MRKGSRVISTQEPDPMAGLGGHSSLVTVFNPCQA